MKQVKLLFLLVILTKLINAQSISPSTNNEYCPNTETTFTIVIPGTYNSIIGIGGCLVSQTPYNFSSSGGNTTFNFKGKFTDANQAQTFRVSYTTANGSPTYDAIFKRIKSLFFSTVSTAFPPCNVIKPNQTQPLVFPRCQVSSATISFPNIQWFTNFENPEVCFGSVTDYEYQLPNNWSIGGFTSTGNNWIAGGNSVVVTSDLSTGDGVDIRIRASNKTCGTGLAANGPVATVRISRPAPPLTIPETATIICSGSLNYSLTGLPSGATVVWSLSSNANASLSNQTNTSVTVTRNSSINTTVTLIATVTHCTFSYNVNKLITLGTPSLGYSVYPYYQGQQFCTNSFGNTLKVEPQNLGNVFIEWTSLNMSDPNYNLVMVNSNGSYEQDFVFYTAGTYQIAARVGNSCGLGDYTAFLNIEVSDNCSGGGFRAYNISPNPSKGNIIVTSVSKTNAIKEIIISDKMGSVKKRIQFPANSKTVNINLSGLKPDIYFIKIFNGKMWESNQIRVD
jgi:hypothetical protein